MDLPNEGLRTDDAPDGTALGGAREIVPCAAAIADSDKPTTAKRMPSIEKDCMYETKHRKPQAARNLETRKTECVWNSICNARTMMMKLGACNLTWQAWIPH